MEIGITILACLIGYLCGSISFARLVTRKVAPDTELKLIQQPIPNTDIVFESDSISASMVRMQVGIHPKWFPPVNPGAWNDDPLVV